jgi:hypothetical protein
MAEPKPSSSVPAKRPPAAVAKPGAPDEPVKPEGRLAWLVGWILVPSVLIGGIFLGGAILGAHRPEGWFARSVMWVASLWG